MNAKKPKKAERCCPLRADACREHGYVHGAEAEELRAGIEKIISDRNSIDDGEPNEHTSPHDAAYNAIDAVLERLQGLLDSVDARDSIAYREVECARSAGEDGDNA